MGKLIDADALIKVMETQKSGNDAHCRLCIDAVKEIIDEQPTAFDVDAVIQQLDDRSTLSRPVGWPKAYEIITLKDVIEIVRNGGKENPELPDWKQNTMNRFERVE